MTELKNNNEYSQMLYPLPRGKYEELKQSIKDHGQEEDIVINEKGEIIDGHHRYHCCLELGITPKFGVTYDFENREHEKAFILSWEEHKLRRKPVEVNPEQTRESNLLCNEGIKLLKQNMFEDAISKCHDALKLDFANPIAYLTLGRIYYEKKLFDKALDFFIQVSDLSRGDKLQAIVIENIALCHIGLNELYEGQYHFDEALNRRPRDVDLVCEQAAFIFKECDINKANSLDQTMTTLNEALEKDPENDEIFSQLENACFVSHSKVFLQQAIGRLEETLKKKPSDRKVSGYLCALKYALAGEDQLAAKELHEVARLSPYDSVAETVASIVNE
jgi:tetratricopeptide (TPR) repeat protein